MGKHPVERVLLIAPALELRGTTLYTLTLARELRLRGYRIGVMSSGGVFSDELQREKVPLIRADISGFTLRNFLYLHRIRALAEEFKPDLIHITHQSLADLGFQIASGLGVPYTFTVHSPLNSRIRVHKQHFRGAIAISQTVRQSVVNAGGLPRDKVCVIENGVATGVQPPPHREPGLIPVVGTVSGLDREYGVKYFIRTVQELIERGVDATFLILGSGPYEKKIHQMIRKLSLQHRITLASAMPSYLKLVSPIDIFVSPALSEGFNVFILQAMSRALPVVASAAGGVFSLLTDNETGLIVPKRDVSLFADKVQAYLDDREYADRIGRNGFDFVQKHYPLHRMIESTLEVYDTMEREAAEADGI
jgi:glycosyltransferase involved in cell wall biosynthesis